MDIIVLKVHLCQGISKFSQYFRLGDSEKVHKGFVDNVRYGVYNSKRKKQMAFKNKETFWGCNLENIICL